MYGAMFGDMVGSRYEFCPQRPEKDFTLLVQSSRYTDDTVMTVAVAEALLRCGPQAQPEELYLALVKAMQTWGRRYPYAGYGGRFRSWLVSRTPQPYRSYGNGSAMRVSSAGWLYPTLERTREVARITAEVTHNHPEGIKGAEATASAIFLARHGAPKEEIRAYIQQEFGYPLAQSYEELRPGYQSAVSCQKTVPEAITAFLDGESFEDVVRNAVALGGDTDTLAAIAGSIAEAFYGVPDDLRAQCRSRLPEDMQAVADRFQTVLLWCAG